MSTFPTDSCCRQPPLSRVDRGFEKTTVNRRKVVKVYVLVKQAAVCCNTVPADLTLRYL